jgi:hypothetical protein
MIQMVWKTSASISDVPFLERNTTNRARLYVEAGFIIYYQTNFSLGLFSSLLFQLHG